MPRVSAGPGRQSAPGTKVRAGPDCATPPFCSVARLLAASPFCCPFVRLFLPMSFLIIAAASNQHILNSSNSSGILKENRSGSAIAVRVHTFHSRIQQTRIENQDSSGSLAPSLDSHFINQSRYQNIPALPRRASPCLRHGRAPSPSPSPIRSRRPSGGRPRNSRACQSATPCAREQSRVNTGQKC